MIDPPAQAIFRLAVSEAGVESFPDFEREMSDVEAPASMQ
jgi:hypothetical protein